MPITTAPGISPTIKRAGGNKVALSLRHHADNPEAFMEVVVDQVVHGNPAQPIVQVQVEAQGQVSFRIHENDFYRAIVINKDGVQVWPV